MHRIDGDDVAVALPAPQAVGGTVGYFAAEGVQPATQVTGDWLNAVQEEIVNVATMDGGSLDKTLRDQMKTVLEHVRALRGASAGALSGSSPWTRALLAATTSDAEVANSLSAAALNCEAKSERSACIASDDCDAGDGTDTECATLASAASNATGSQSAVVAGNASVASGDGSVCVGGANNTASAAHAACVGGSNNTVAATGNSACVGGSNNSIAAGASGIILGGDDNTIDGDTNNAIIASVSSQSPGAVKSGVTILSSRYCDPGLGTVAPISSIGGGYDAGTTLVNRSWACESNGGFMRSDSAHTTAGLDYAEHFENGDKVPHDLGKLIALRGKRAHRARRGDPILGAVSAHPTVVGGDDTLGWRGAYARDEFGGYVWADVEQVDLVEDEVAMRAFRVRRAELRANVRTARKLATKEPGVSVASQLAAAEADLAALVAPPRVEVRTTVRARVRNPAWDPARKHTPRSQRPAEHTCVGLLGQLRVRVDASVAEGDMLMPTDEGDGTKASRDYLLDAMLAGGTRVRCMSVEVPFDADKGYGVALCLVR